MYIALHLTLVREQNTTFIARIPRLVEFIYVVINYTRCCWDTTNTGELHFA